MRVLAPIVLGLCLAGLMACSNAKPPTGRWEGTYDGPDVMIAARLQIDSDGSIFLSAPDAIDFPTPSEQQRAAMHERLSAELAKAWGDVTPRHYDFDGHTFRKSGGIAPQMEWDDATKQMTVIVYLERRPGVRIPLHAVPDFTANPWATTL